MWFGTRAFMQEITDPQIEPDYASVGWSEATPYLNGGLGVASSSVAHQEYFFSWSPMSRAEVRQVTDYADGVHGDGVIYFLDPVAADQNVLPQSWAVPALAGYVGGAIPLAGTDRPVLSANTDQSQGYPSKLATYTLAAETVLRSWSHPIPPGHSAWVGIHGDAGAQDRVKVTPFVGEVAGTVVHPTILSASTTTRVNTEITGTWLELSLDKTTPGACPLVGLIVQILPTGVTPETGGFISGQGNSGCRFLGRPMRVPHTVGGGLDLVMMSAKLGEVGEWE